MLQSLSRQDQRGFNLHAMILISCLFHIVAILVLFFAPSVPSRQWTFGPIYSVNLVSMPETIFEKKVASSSLSKEFTETIGVKQTVTVKKSDALEPIPIRRIEAAKNKEQDNAIEKVLENLRKKNSVETAETPRTTPAAARAEAASGGSAGAANKFLQRYYAEIWARIQSQWAFPQSLSTKEALFCVVNVTITRSGAISDLHIDRRSGNRYFDDSAVKAVRKASPFPPLPADIGDRSIDLGIRFHSKDLR